MTEDGMILHDLSPVRLSSLTSYDSPPANPNVHTYYILITLGKDDSPLIGLWTSTSVHAKASPLETPSLLYVQALVQMSASP